MATNKKSAQKPKKATLKPAKKTKNSTKSVSKSSPKGSIKKVAKKSEPKKVANKTAIKPVKKAIKKVEAKKTSSKKVEAKANKGLLNKIVSKLSSKKNADVISSKSSDKLSSKENVKNKSQKGDSKLSKASIKDSKATKVQDESMLAKNSQKNIAELTQEFTDKKTVSASAEVLLTDAEGRVLCKYSGCDEIATVEGYCRYHYLLNWKRIQLKKKILSEGKLEKYINELTAKYPDKYVDMLKGDLKSEKDFLSVVNELEIDDSDNTMSDDEEDSYIEQEVQAYQAVRDQTKKTINAI